MKTQHLHYCNKKKPQIEQKSNFVENIKSQSKYIKMFVKSGVNLGQVWCKSVKMLV